MQNKLIIGAVVLVVIAAGAVFFMKGGTGSFSTMGNTSLRALLSSNASQKCSFNNGDSSGTIYVGAGKMRGDFTSKTEGATAQTHMIISNDIVYVWLDGTAQGFRTAFSDMKPNSTSQGGVDADAKVATDCTSWQATESSFELPANVTFMAAPSANTGTMPQGSAGGDAAHTDASAHTSAGASAGATMDYHAQQCAACNMVTDPTAKMQCKASFDCPSQ
jgi:hypothetical protein